MDYWGDSGDSDVPLPEHPDDRVTVDRAYPGTFGGYAGREVEVHEAPVAWSETAEGATSDGWWAEPTMDVWPDFSVGGSTGTVTALPYSMGPVDPSNVENLELTGRILVPGRDPERGAGPVGAENYRSDLILQIVQAVGPEYDSAMAAVGLLSGA